MHLANRGRTARLRLHFCHQREELGTKAVCFGARR